MADIVTDEFEQSPPKVITPQATITDQDSVHFGGGQLTVPIAGVHSGDRLSIRNEGNSAGQIGVSGAQVRFGGILNGTFPIGGLSPLRDSLNTNATVAATLRHNGTIIGTVNVGGGIGATPLSVTFNSTATRSIVAQAVRSITFQISNPTAEGDPTRIIPVSLTDGDGGSSNVRTLTVDPEFVRG